jgi:hypothetical protein
MVAKQINGTQAPDGSQYVTLTDGSNNLSGTITSAGYSAAPAGTTVLQSSSGNVAAATATATLAGAASVTTYLSGFLITGAGATAGSVVNGTITGTIGGTMTFTVPVATGATVGNTPIDVYFSPPLPASATNTAIVVSVPSLGAGNTNSTVSAWGYRV